MVVSNFGVPEIPDTVESQKIRVVLAVGQSAAFGKSRAADSNDVIAVENPIDILESVKKTIIAGNHLFFDCPVPQVRRRTQYEPRSQEKRIDPIMVPSGVNLPAIFVITRIDKSPIFSALLVVMDGEFFSSARHIDKIRGGSKVIVYSSATWIKAAASLQFDSSMRVTIVSPPSGSGTIHPSCHWLKLRCVSCVIPELANQEFGPPPRTLVNVQFSFRMGSASCAMERTAMPFFPFRVKCPWHARYVPDIRRRVSGLRDNLLRKAL